MDLTWLKRIYDFYRANPEIFAALKTLLDAILANIKAVPESVDIPEFDAAVAEWTANDPPEAVGDLIGTLRKLYQLAKANPEIMAGLQALLSLLL